MIDLEEITHAIQGSCAVSEYFPYLWRHRSRIGFRFGEQQVLCVLESDGSSECQPSGTSFPEGTDLLLEMPFEQLLSFVRQKRDGVDVKVRSVDASKVPLSLQMLANRVFQKSFDKKFPVSDREDLIYHSLFSFKQPTVLWEASKLGVRALLYPEAYEGSDVYVSSGFSNPGMKPAAIKSEYHKIMGYGYELIMFAKPTARFLKDIFVYAVATTCETRHHLMRDHYVRFDKSFSYERGSLAGLVVVTPKWIPEYFPLQNGVAYWNLLVGVREDELRIAEKQGVEAEGGLLDRWDADKRGDLTEQ